MSRGHRGQEQRNYRYGPYVLRLEQAVPHLEPCPDGGPEPLVWVHARREAEAGIPSAAWHWDLSAERQDDQLTIHSLAGKSFALAHVLDQALPPYLGQKGHLVLHAGSVHGDRAVAWLGEAGAGKSTLVAESSARGMKALSDDILIVRPEGAKPLAVAPSCGLRLCPDAATRLADRLSAEWQNAGCHNGKTWFLPRSKPRQVTRPLSCLILLKPGFSIPQPAPSAVAVQGLLASSFVNDTSDMEAIRHRFDQVTDLVARLPVWQASRPETARDWYRFIDWLRSAVAN